MFFYSNDADYTSKYCQTQAFFEQFYNWPKLRTGCETTGCDGMSQGEDKRSRATNQGGDKPTRVPYYERRGDGEKSQDGASPRSVHSEHVILRSLSS